jgi:gamma-glutamyl hercynylcysteine S-oxide synthase
LATASTQSSQPKPPPLPLRDGSRRTRIAALLERTRQRTLTLIEPLSEQALNAVHDPLMSPIAWDLGHIASFEELWLVQRAAGRAPLREELGGVYDPFSAPRRERGRLPYLRSEECLDYIRAVRERTLACLEEVELSDGATPLLAGGFVYELVARHEQQHSETILQTLQSMTAETYEPPRVIAPQLGLERREMAERSRAIETARARQRVDGMVLVGGGPFEMGASGAWFSYDNERPAHERELEPFWIDAEPVTSGALIEFIDDRGYERPELWSSEGWEWRSRERIVLPRYWERGGNGLVERSFGQLRPVEPSKPICHVSWYEADAYARWAGKRLPTEAEWERAASWDPDAGVKRSYPWGDAPPDSERANLDQLAFGRAEAGVFPAGESACGARQMIGDVWEWTASTFDGYEGFEPFPYREYSEPFFGQRFKVLRGGAWATQPDAVSTTFRNWDYPERRQIFAGFRCARDAGPDGQPA